MTIPSRRGTATRAGRPPVTATAVGPTVPTAPARLCFVVEERYESDVMPGAVVGVLRSWGHQVAPLDPHATATGLRELPPSDLPTDVARYRGTRRAVAGSRPTGPHTPVPDSPFAPDQEATA